VIDNSYVGIGMENKKLLVDTLELIHKLDEAVERYKGRDEHGELLTDDRVMDDMVEDGIACKLQFVGKYLTRTSEEFKIKHQGLPWNLIAAIPYLVSYEYKFGKRPVWNLYYETLPEIKELVISILKKEYGYPQDSTQKIIKT